MCRGFQEMFIADYDFFLVDADLPERDSFDGGTAGDESPEGLPPDNDTFS